MSLIRALAGVALTKTAAITAVAVAASGGVALAAVSGNTPPNTPPSPASSHSTAANAGSDDTNDSLSPSGQPSASPSPSLTGLCHAWLAGAGSKHGHARTNPAFTVLVTAAGGSGNVAAYCTTRLAAQTHPAGPSTTPSHPAHPTGRPEKVAPSHPTHPTGAPTSVPPSHP
jgi:hypothetical protein